MSQTLQLSTSTNSILSGNAIHFKEGDCIDGQITLPSGSKRWFPGKVVYVHEDESFDVVYDDGEKECNKSIAELRMSKKRPGMSRPPSKVDLGAPSPASNPSLAPKSPSRLSVNSNEPSPVISVEILVDSPPCPLHYTANPPLHTIDPYAKNENSPSNTCSHKQLLQSPITGHSDVGTTSFESPEPLPVATASRRDSAASSVKDEDEDLVFDIPSVFAEADLNRRLHSADGK
jgi:hypothetical protein